MKISGISRSAAFAAASFTLTPLPRKLLTLILIGALACGSLRAQFTVSQPPANGGAECTYTLDNHTLPLTANLPVHKYNPFYWTFWLYGNGEYAPEMSPNRAHCWENYPFPGAGVSASWTTAQVYKYPAPYNLTFNPIAFSIPRKDDNPPPGAYAGHTLPAGATVGIPGLGFAATPRIQSIPAGSPKRVYLAHSHGFLSSYLSGNEKSVFIVTYKPRCLTGNWGKVLLYFGAKRSGGVLSASSHVTKTVSYDPLYYAGQTGDSHHNAPPAFPAFSDGRAFEFNPAYVQNVKNALGVPEGDPEFRLFEEVEFSSPATLGPNDWSYALAVLTSPEPCSLVDAGVVPLLAGLATYSPPYLTIGGDYVVDADTIFLKNGEPIDPNGLKITNICRCDGGNAYQVTFKLFYHNSSNMAAQPVRIRFDNWPSGFEFCKLLEVRGDHFTMTTGFPWDACSRTLNLSQPIAPGEVQTLTFTLTTNMAFTDLVKRLKSASLVSGDIQFLPSTVVMPFSNAVIPMDQQVEDAACPSACSCDAATLCFPLWGYVVIGIFVLGVLWFYNRRKILSK